MRYWWVNQSQSYEAERKEGLLWAPLHSSSGRTQPHWETMTEVLPGDVIFHYAAQAVRAVSTATATAVTSPRPDSLPPDLWGRDGRLLRVSYREASSPVSRHDIPEAWKKSEPQNGAFRHDAVVKLGYLWPLSNSFGKNFLDRFGTRFPTATTKQKVPDAPPEALAGAADLVRRLIGVELRTLTGNQNRILGVTPGDALVATDRSPAGSPVPITELQDALDLLIKNGFVVINPENVGFRSSFIGAVLRTIPGVQVEKSPRNLTLRLVRATTDPNDDGAAWKSPNTVTFEGDLSIATTGEARGEQAMLRRALLDASTTAACAICGDTYPTRFLVAAHIKKRAVCSDDERRDLANIAMVACVFGCDALYETGYLTVDGNGRIAVSTIDGSPATERRLKDLGGRGCSAFSTTTAAYFEWHRTNIWRG